MGDGRIGTSLDQALDDTGDASRGRLPDLGVFAAETGGSFPEAGIAVSCLEGG
jgi:hypothetical protein